MRRFTVSVITVLVPHWGHIRSPDDAWHDSGTGGRQLVPLRYACESEIYIDWNKFVNYGPKCSRVSSEVASTWEIFICIILYHRSAIADFRFTRTGKMIEIS